MIGERSIGLAAIMVLAGGTVTTLAQGTTAQQQQSRTIQNILDRQRQIDDALEAERLEQEPIASLLDWQWGGWIEHYSFFFDDGVQSSRWLHRPSTSLWTRLTIDDGNHELFARGRLTFNYFHPGDEYDRQQDWEGPNLERGWYRVRVGRALRLLEPDDPYGFDVKVGRQEVVFGTGYTLDLPLDGVTFSARWHDWTLTGLIARSIASTPNIDVSEPVDSHMSRRFYGVQLDYTGFEDHQPFVFALWNDDFTDERPTMFFQNYSYDTQYFGLGSRGQLIPNLNYWTEWVYETGKSYGDRQWLAQDDVRAWAWDIGLEYYFNHPTKPRVMFEYMFASGDGDRFGSPTSAAGGNTRGDDTSFVAFGYRDTGISAGLIPSNLHIFKFGGSFFPLPDHQVFRDMELGSNWFIYHKHHQSGAVSDPTADRSGEGFVGWEMDYYVNWRVLTDVSWTVRWGAFFPGEAYSDRGMRNFLFTGVTWSF